MPLVECTTENGKPGWKWGEGNKSCFTSKKKALEQGRITEMKKHGKADNNLIQAISSHLELNEIESVVDIEISVAEGGMQIETLIFSKTKFKTSKDAKDWAKSHGFKSDGVDETSDSFRIRQTDPSKFDKKSFRTIKLKDGVSAVVGKPT